MKTNKDYYLYTPLSVAQIRQDMVTICSREFLIYYPDCSICKHKLLSLLIERFKKLRIHDNYVFITSSIEKTDIPCIRINFLKVIVQCYKRVKQTNFSGFNVIMNNLFYLAFFQPLYKYKLFDYLLYK